MSDSGSEYSVIEMVKDNYGHQWHGLVDTHSYVLTDVMLQPGNLLTITVALNCPLKNDQYLGFQLGYDKSVVYQKELVHTFKITEERISRSIAVYVRISHLLRDRFMHDPEDDIQFRYTVISAVSAADRPALAFAKVSDRAPTWARTVDHKV